jgi:hypothetical protein
MAKKVTSTNIPIDKILSAGPVCGKLPVVSETLPSLPVLAGAGSDVLGGVVWFDEPELPFPVFSFELDGDCLFELADGLLRCGCELV